jgi:hypothetical protein
MLGTIGIVLHPKNNRPCALHGSVATVVANPNRVGGIAPQPVSRMAQLAQGQGRDALFAGGTLAVG